jgi:hypothetical protein
MVVATPIPNVMMVRFPGPLSLTSTGEAKPFRAEIVCFLEVCGGSLQVWYSHHEFFDHECPSGCHHMPVDQFLDHWIRHSVMRELWLHFSGESGAGAGGAAESLVRPISEWTQLPNLKQHPGMAALLPNAPERIV